MHSRAENEMGIIVMPTLFSGNLSSGGMSVFTLNNKLGVPSSCKEGWKLVKWGSSADAPGTVELGLGWGSSDLKPSGYLCHIRPARVMHQNNA